MANLQSLFPGMEILEAHPFHVTRDADSAIQELEAGDLMESVEEGVWQRRFADVIRLEVNDDMPAAVLEIQQRAIFIAAPFVQFMTHGYSRSAEDGAG